MGGVAVAAVNEIVSAGEGRGSDGGITTATVGETVDHGLLRGNHLAKLGQLLLKGVQLRSKVAQGHGILRIRGIGQPLQLSAAGIVAIRRHVRQALAFIPQIACILQLLIGHIATQVGSCRNRRFVLDEGWRILVCFFPVSLHPFTVAPIESLYGERHGTHSGINRGNCGGAVLDYASDSSIRPIDGSPCWRLVTDLNGDQTILVTGHVLNGLAIQHVLTRTEDTHLHRQRGIVHQFIVAVTNHRLVTQFLGEHLRRQQ